MHNENRIAECIEVEADIENRIAECIEVEADIDINIEVEVELGLELGAENVDVNMLLTGVKHDLSNFENETVTLSTAAISVRAIVSNIDYVGDDDVIVDDFDVNPPITSATNTVAATTDAIVVAVDVAVADDHRISNSDCVCIISDDSNNYDDGDDDKRKYKGMVLSPPLSLPYSLHDTSVALLPLSSSFSSFSSTAHDNSRIIKTPTNVNQDVNENGNENENEIENENRNEDDIYPMPFCNKISLSSSPSSSYSSNISNIFYSDSQILQNKIYLSANEKENRNEIIRNKIFDNGKNEKKNLDDKYIISSIIDEYNYNDDEHDDDNEIDEDNIDSELFPFVVHYKENLNENFDEKNDEKLYPFVDIALSTYDDLCVRAPSPGILINVVENEKILSNIMNLSSNEIRFTQMTRENDKKMDSNTEYYNIIKQERLIYDDIHTYYSEEAAQFGRNEVRRKFERKEVVIEGECVCEEDKILVANFSDDNIDREKNERENIKEGNKCSDNENKDDQENDEKTEDTAEIKESRIKLIQKTFLTALSVQNILFDFLFETDEGYSYDDNDNKDNKSNHDCIKNNNNNNNNNSNDNNKNNDNNNNYNNNNNNNNHYNNNNNINKNNN